MIYRGMPVLMPGLQGESAEEILSEMSFPAYLGLLMLNQNTYGGNWMKDFINLRYGGQTPSEYYAPLKEHKKMGRMYSPRTGAQRMVDRLLGTGNERR